LELEWSQGLESVGSEHIQTYNTLRTSFPPVAEIFWVSGNAFADIRQVVMLLEPKRKKCEETYPKKVVSLSAVNMSLKTFLLSWRELHQAAKLHGLHGSEYHEFCSIVQFLPTSLLADIWNNAGGPMTGAYTYKDIPQELVLQRLLIQMAISKPVGKAEEDQAMIGFKSLSLAQKDGQTFVNYFSDIQLAVGHYVNKNSVFLGTLPEDWNLLHAILFSIEDEDTFGFILISWLKYASENDFNVDLSNVSRTELMNFLFQQGKDLDSVMLKYNLSGHQFLSNKLDAISDQRLGRLIKKWRLVRKFHQDSLTGGKPSQGNNNKSGPKKPKARLSGERDLPTEEEASIAPAIKKAKKEKRKAKREAARAKAKVKADGEKPEAAATPAKPKPKVKKLNEPKPHNKDCRNCIHKGDLELAKTCSQKGDCVCPNCGRPYSCCQQKACCWFGAGKCTWKKRPRDADAPEVPKGKVKCLRVKSLIVPQEEFLKLFTREQVQDYYTRVNAMNSLIQTSKDDLDSSAFVAPQIVSKATGLGAYLSRTEPATQRNCFDVTINSFRTYRRVGAGDTMADANLMGNILLEKINSELRISNPSKVLVVLKSKLPFVVEIADGNDMELTEYVEVDMEIYVEDPEDSNYETFLPISRKVVIWIVQGDMNEILLGAKWLQDHCDIYLDEIIRKHPRAKRILKEVREPRAPQLERVGITSSEPKSRLKMSQESMMKAVYIPVIKYAAAPTPNNNGFNMAGRLGPIKVDNGSDRVIEESSTTRTVTFAETDNVSVKQPSPTDYVGNPAINFESSDYEE